MAFDAVAGRLTQKLLEAMPDHSRVTVFGRLSRQPAQAGVDHLVFQNEAIDGSGSGRCC